ncbi:hypothetical protein H4R99_002998 [Coemansia sp. RSA 1722]|nr:hypothetical protein H4R99_002998 [Coemansia sp. RSA 1722]
MPLFGKRKPKLNAAISEAAVDDKSYGKMYHTFSKNTDAGADVVKFVIDTVINPPKELTKKRNRLLLQSSRLSINVSSSNVNVGASEDASIVICISYLTALHGLVWTFPRDMVEAFSDPETSILLLGVISSTAIPLLVRETLLCMVSNWCVLFRESVNARLNLESIVDTAKVKFGLRPLGHLLPDPPFTRGQEDWPYPTTRREPQQEQYNNSQIFASIPSMASARKTPQAQQVLQAAAPPQNPQLQRQAHQQPQYQQPQYQQPQYQQQPRYQQQPQQPQPQPQQPLPQPPQQHKRWDIKSLGRPASQESAAKPSSTSGTVPSPAVSQKRSILSSLRSSPQSTRPALPAPPTARSESRLTPEFIAHIELSIKELVSICDMLTETLISLNVQEDPSQNAVVQDMNGEVKQRKTALFNFMSMLGSDTESVMVKLTSATDCADKCLWLYDKTLSSHNEWKTIQESLRTSAAEEVRNQALDSTVRSTGSVRSYLNMNGDMYAESSKSVAKLLAAAAAAGGASSAPPSSTTGGASSPAISASGSLSTIHRAPVVGASSVFASGTSANGLSTPVVRQEMSSKAKGKMAEDPSQPNTDSQDWDYHNDDSAYGGSIEDATRVSN